MPAAMTSTRSAKAACRSRPGASAARPSKQAERAKHTSAVAGRVRAASESLEVANLPSGESCGARWSRNCAKTQRCAATTIATSCSARPHARAAAPGAALSPPAASGCCCCSCCCCWSRPCRTVPAAKSRPAARRAPPKRSRPTHHAASIVKSTPPEATTVRVATEMYSSALLVQPISMPCTPPRAANLTMSPQPSGGSGAACGRAMHDRPRANKPVALFVRPERAKG
mmetsp:Transcript_66667/g.206164  ORF Transcript_66667/g.206164 Transcript_66667/m.206164 type:complete len:228 (-) Transcript_66667:329-1012(-)